MRILFTGVGRRIELLQAFRSAALVLNKELKIYGADISDLAPALAYCDYTRKTVSMKDPCYIDNLLAICKIDHIDMVIPTIDTDLLILSRNREVFERSGVKVLISAPEMIAICRDKYRTYQFFGECGLCSPKPVCSVDKYEGGFPAFIKPKDGSASINAYRVDSMESLRAYAGVIKDYIIQPFINGKEYTIDVFCDYNGTPLSIVPRERIQVRAGEVLVTKICMDQRMIDGARAICDRCKPSGPITIQLIRDEEGKDWYIEINPRYGGGAPLSMKAGARSAEAVLRMLDGEHTIGYYQEIADGVIYSRFDQSICVKKEKIKGQKKGKLEQIRGVIFDLDDTLYSEKEYVRSGFRAVANYLDGDYEDRLWRFFEAGKPAIDELLKELHRESEKDDVLTAYRFHKPDIHLYKDVAEMITSLKYRGMKIGIITDGRPEGQRNKIEALGLDRLVDDVIVTDELGGTQFRKPCDIAFRIMQTKWKFDPSEIVYIGDNPVKDFQAVSQLGMKGVYFCNSQGVYFSRDDICRPNYTVMTITDIVGLLKGI